MNNRYVRGEPAEGPASDKPQHPVLRLTTDHVRAATGIPIGPGMTVEYRFDGNECTVRVLDSASQAVLADWATVDF